VAACIAPTGTADDSALKGSRGGGRGGGRGPFLVEFVRGCGNVGLQAGTPGRRYVMTPAVQLGADGREEDRAADRARQHVGHRWPFGVEWP
jgi:hypothetical protein